MNTPDPDPRVVMESLIEEIEREAAPSFATVREGLRRVKRQRRRNRWFGLASVAVVGCVLFIALRPPVVVQPVETNANIPLAVAVTRDAPAPVASPDAGPSEAEWRIERVDDQQLLELLGDAPVALASYPDGQRRLMLLVDVSPVAGSAGQ